MKDFNYGKWEMKINSSTAMRIIHESDNIPSLLIEFKVNIKFIYLIEFYD